VATFQLYWWRKTKKPLSAFIQAQAAPEKNQGHIIRFPYLKIAECFLMLKKKWV
jgi:hypothetical protein